LNVQTDNYTGFKQYQLALLPTSEKREDSWTKPERWRWLQTATGKSGLSWQEMVR